MNVSDAVRQRRSIRDFRSDPVPRALLAEILDAARWAPSGSNVQAWRLIAVAGAERDAIVDMARRAECDLIVMATHGRHGLDALINGSLTKSVLSHSQIPLLVVH